MTEVTLPSRPDALHWPYQSTPNVWITRTAGDPELWSWRCTRCDVGGHGFRSEEAASADYSRHQLDRYSREVLR